MCRWIFVLLVFRLGCLTPEALADEPPASPEYQKYFQFYSDGRSIPERVLNSVGLTDQEVGPGFALIAGVSNYKKLGSLPAAAADMQNLVSYLRNYEYFSEIVVLNDDAFTEDNLRYFLQAYFPSRLKKFPRSRFLFAFSGHGANDGDDGYLLESSAEDFDDRAHEINLSVIRTMMKGEIRSGFQILALINACYGGNFVEASFGNPKFYPTLAGAHGLTAGGPNELVYKSSDGPGSLFFDTILSGLDQRADTFPPSNEPQGRSGDGIITFDELATWVKLTVRYETQQQVNPIDGDLNPPGKRSLGSFFFINRRRLIDASLVPSWQPPTWPPPADSAFGQKNSDQSDQNGSAKTDDGSGNSRSEPSSLSDDQGVGSIDSTDGEALSPPIDQNQHQNNPDNSGAEEMSGQENAVPPNPISMDSRTQLDTMNTEATANGEVAVFQSPYQQSEMSAAIPAGSPFIIDGKVRGQESWYHIAYAGTTGYAKLDLVNSPSQSAVEPPASPAALAVAEIQRDAGDSVYFNVNGVIPRPGGIATVTKWASILKKYPEVTATLDGYQARSEDSINPSLGYLRAQRILDQLNIAGVARDRMSTVGYGSSRPLATGDGESAAAQDRRVVIQINQ